MPEFSPVPGTSEGQLHHLADLLEPIMEEVFEEEGIKILMPPAISIHTNRASVIVGWGTKIVAHDIVCALKPCDNLIEITGNAWIDFVKPHHSPETITRLLVATATSATQANMESATSKQFFRQVLKTVVHTTSRITFDRILKSGGETAFFIPRSRGVGL